MSVMQIQDWFYTWRCTFYTGRYCWWCGSYKPWQICDDGTGNINYLRPAMNCKKLIGESREIKIGKKMCVYDVMITDENDREIAKATMTYFYLDKINAEDFVK